MRILMVDTSRQKTNFHFACFAARYLLESSCVQENDIDAVLSIDIIRWHLAKQVNLEAVVETADYVPP